MPPPLCRTLEEMRRLRCPPPPPSPPTAPCPVQVHHHTACTHPYVPTTIVVVPGDNGVNLADSQCLFFPYVCAQNRVHLHEWCRACTHRRLFPEASTHSEQVCQRRPW